jgi:hypothetical protein
LEAFLNIPRPAPVSLSSSSGKKQNFWSWDYPPQVLDYQDFLITRSWINGILL